MGKKQTIWIASILVHPTGPKGRRFLAAVSADSGKPFVTVAFAGALDEMIHRLVAKTKEDGLDIIEVHKIYRHNPSERPNHAHLSYVVGLAPTSEDVVFGPFY
ncbi:MAG: hypothetical protein IT462_08070 [Planctomycetes bacterium]|nr:hypothetical protein [Planctomycetota bacterium]